MKLVIETQHCENYGEANSPYWKFKGGSIYVVENLTPAQVKKIRDNGIPTLSKLITTDNPMFREYVLSYNVVEDSEKVCADWERPVVLRFSNGVWTAAITDEADEFSRYTSLGIAKSVRTYTLQDGGEHKDFACNYYMVNGDVVSGKEIDKYLTEKNLLEA